MPSALVVMGVSGCGKSTLARQLAAELNWFFFEGDDLHPQRNIEKMSRGEPLTDSDRAPFLQNVAMVLREHQQEGIVVSCSALKRIYRDAIRYVCPTVKFVLPQLTTECLQLRLNNRKNHFMPATLLQSQIDTLEPIMADEDGLVIDGILSSSEQVQCVLKFLHESD